MIYGASLGPFAKKGFGDRAFQTNVNKMIEALPVPPAVSNMDAIVLGPKDLVGALGRLLDTAIKKKHPDIKVLFFYQKDKEAELISGDVHKIKVDKVTPQSIQAGVEQVMEAQRIGGDHRVLASADERAFQPPVESTQAAEERADVGLKASEQRSFEETVLLSNAGSEAAATLETPVVHQAKALEQRVLEMGRYADFNFMRDALDTQLLANELVQENTQYAGVINMLETLDRQMMDIFKSAHIPAEVRFAQIRQLAVDRAAYKGIEGSIIAEKLSSVMTAIVQAAEATVETRIHTIREALDKVASVKEVFEDHGKLQALIDSRLALQMDLMELSKDIIEVYKAMDRSVAEVLKEVEQGLPSENAYLNEILKPTHTMFQPQNISAVTVRLIGDLQQNRISLSIMEDKLKSLINLVFKLCEEDAVIIEYQQKLIQLLRAQRVEDVVIVDNVIKNAIRLFVGPADTGRTATALTWSGVAARRQNTLLLDLTGNSKLRQYGVEPVSLDHFLQNRIEEPLVCIEGDVSDVERVETIVAELKMRLNYYAHIHVILDAGQTDLLQQLSPSALAVHFITDCSHRGNALLKQTISAFQEPNIAQKIILIDPPVEPSQLLPELGADPLLVKLIVLPRLQHIRACAFHRSKPYDSREVVDVFEEAFR
ncbi:hypothetical protein B5M42_000930 [Paenibacillus athensensis]|uniref:Uncharacterized protein n=1 Tax=Paenibacillus athensensis TaxID=1967502 RepID=A0A4Y8Q798_9BACL|nr:hypothetical protein [Paenibacillus athensensis]MCD1257399.1 hypothetical protein [Paenibacillus athensensis]